MKSHHSGAEAFDPPRLVIKSKGSLHFIRTQDLDRCEADGNYIRVHVGQQQHHVRCTMSHMESQLNPLKFVRVHRSTIVNIDRIQELRPMFNGDYMILLRDQTRLALSRSYRGRLLEIIVTRRGATFLNR